MLFNTCNCLWCCEPIFSRVWWLDPLKPHHTWCSLDRSWKQIMCICIQNDPWPHPRHHFHPPVRIFFVLVQIPDCMRWLFPVWIGKHNQDCAPFQIFVAQTLPFVERWTTAEPWRFFQIPSLCNKGRDVHLVSWPRKLSPSGNTFWPFEWPLQPDVANVIVNYRKLRKNKEMYTGKGKLRSTGDSMWNKRVSAFRRRSLEISSHHPSTFAVHRPFLWYTHGTRKSGSKTLSWECWKH